MSWINVSTNPFNAVDPTWLPLSHREPPDFDAFEEEAPTVVRARPDRTQEVTPLPFHDPALQRAPVKPGAAVILSRIFAVLTLVVVAFGMVMIASW
ncbi:MAG: hypothetical protein KC503_01795 [Myxococcales bacterium]|nr:hypothetical protein [Myxococcales bacterium]